MSFTLNDNIAIAIRNVNHFYGSGDGRKQVLFNINLTIKKGEIVIMTGPSGSGKTTLLTLIGALRSVQDGSIHLLGQELHGLDINAQVMVRRNIGFIFQAHNLFESLTARDNILMALDLKSLPGKEMERMAEDILTQVGLKERIHYRPSNLSGGQRQRVAIARAMVCKPGIILADEPTAALDKESGRNIVDMLRKLADNEKATILIVTHDNRILDVADRIVNMVDGTIIANVLVQESIKLCNFLQKCKVFNNLSPAILTKVSEKMVKEEYSVGSKIINQGDNGDKFYLITEGEIDVFVRKGDEEKRVATLGVGNFIGEAALLTNESRNATCIAKSDSRLYSLDKENFKFAVEHSPSFKDQLMHIYFQRQ